MRVLLLTECALLSTYPMARPVGWRSELLKFDPIGNEELIVAVFGESHGDRWRRLMRLRGRVRCDREGRYRPISLKLARERRKEYDECEGNGTACVGIGGEERR